MRTVLDLIRRTGARLTLVHALRNALPNMVFSGGEAVRLTRNLRGLAAQVAEHLRQKIPADVSIRADVRVTTGDPHRGILDIASEVKADLIVMGVPPRSRFDEVLFGSTLRAVLRRMKIPVGTSSTCRRVQMARGEGQCGRHDALEESRTTQTTARALVATVDSSTQDERPRSAA